MELISRGDKQRLANLRGALAFLHLPPTEREVEMVAMMLTRALRVPRRLGRPLVMRWLGGTRCLVARLLPFLLLASVSIDLGSPFTPGNFVFEADASLEISRIGLARALSTAMPLPVLTPAWGDAVVSSSEVARLRTSAEVIPPHEHLASCCLLPRAHCVAPRSTADPL